MGASRRYYTYGNEHSWEDRNDSADQCGDLRDERHARSIEFYRKLGFEVVYGGERAGFTSLRAGEAFVKLVASAEASRD